jgi:hypothetical protein
VLSLESWQFKQQTSRQKKVTMNGVLAQINGCTTNKFGNNGSWGEINKSNSIMSQCFVYSFIEHKIYNYPFKGVT